MRYTKENFIFVFVAIWSTTSAWTFMDVYLARLRQLDFDHIQDVANSIPSTKWDPLWNLCGEFSSDDGYELSQESVFQCGDYLHSVMATVTPFRVTLGSVWNTIDVNGNNKLDKYEAKKAIVALIAVDAQFVMENYNRQYIDPNLFQHLQSTFPVDTPLMYSVGRYLGIPEQSAFTREPLSTIVNADWQAAKTTPEISIDDITRFIFYLYPRLLQASIQSIWSF